MAVSQEGLPQRRVHVRRCLLHQKPDDLSAPILCSDVQRSAAKAVHRLHCLGHVVTPSLHHPCVPKRPPSSKVAFDSPQRDARGAHQ